MGGMGVDGKNGNSIRWKTFCAINGINAAVGLQEYEKTLIFANKSIKSDMKKIFCFMCFGLVWAGVVLCFIACRSSESDENVPHIPILGWYSIPGGASATLEHYQEMKDCGFDYSFAHIHNYEDAIQALDLCAQVGLKSIFTCPELEKEPEETVQKVMNHPGLGGYFLRDEPGNDSMEGLGAWARRIESVDSIHPCYLNLLPSFVFTPDGYEEHLRLFTEKVNLPQISFDHYPINDNNGEVFINPRWYENLELVRSECLRVGKPFWAFALSTAHTPYPIPTIDHLRLQMYSNLAYGAQLLQYFTYWNPGTETWNFHEAPITLEGHRSPVYELVRQMNEEIQRRAFVWDGCSVESVCHVADSVPQGTKPLATLPAHFRKIENVSGQGLVSVITNGGRHFVMLVNTSPVQRWHVNVETDENVVLIRQDATSAPVTRYGPLFILSPGNCEVFEVK